MFGALASSQSSLTPRSDTGAGGDLLDRLNDGLVGAKGLRGLKRGNRLRMSLASKDWALATVPVIALAERRTTARTRCRARRREAPLFPGSRAQMEYSTLHGRDRLDGVSS